jgi:hypothetical protein
VFWASLLPSAHGAGVLSHTRASRSQAACTRRGVPRAAWRRCRERDCAAACGALCRCVHSRCAARPPRSARSPLLLPRTHHSRARRARAAAARVRAACLGRTPAAAPRQRRRACAAAALLAASPICGAARRRFGVSARDCAAAAAGCDRGASPTRPRAAGRCMSACRAPRAPAVQPAARPVSRGGSALDNTLSPKTLADAARARGAWRGSYAGRRCCWHVGSEPRCLPHRARRCASVWFSLRRLCTVRVWASWRRGGLASNTRA